MKEKKPKRLHWRYKLLLAVLVAAVAFAGIYFYLRYQTYENVRVIKTYEEGGSDNANYVECMGGILRYSRDGVALLAEDGEEAWNQACQMNNPIVEICGNTVAIGDKGGTSIYVFEEKGLKGEIQTTRPIEKMEVSKQGIVTAILKDEEAPLVMCYDAEGNMLVKHTTSLKKTGYPLDVAISEDGIVLLVSYLTVQGNTVSSKIVYYDFSEAGEDKEQHQIYQKEYENMVIPTVEFLDKDTALLVSDTSLIVYEGLEAPKESVRVEFQNEVLSAAYTEKMIAVLLKDAGQTGQKLYMYDTKGKELAAVEVEREYADMKVAENQVILYEGRFCSIITSDGVYKYKGELETDIANIYPVSGLHKYMMISANGFQVIQLVK